MDRLCAVSVDLDEIRCYAAIHGLEAPEGARASMHAVYDACVDRFRALFDDVGAKATFFAIGSDLSRSAAAKQLRSLADDGHELGNHTLSHLYDLTRRDRDTVRAQVLGGIEAIERATGTRPTGFRAPGYTITDEVFEVLAELGVAYDSSVFPCPAYYAAKTAAIAGIRLRGRRSHSIVDDPRVLTAPADPYRVGHPYWTKGDGLVELPIGVTRELSGRLPFIGTSVALGGEGVARSLARGIAGRPLVSFELHGIDLADAAEDGLDWLRPHQPDLRRTRDEKEAALRAALDELVRAGYAFVTCAEAASSR